jgi:N-acetylneuraminic acid mutarotase
MFSKTFWRIAILTVLFSCFISCQDKTDDNNTPQEPTGGTWTQIANFTGIPVCGSAAFAIGNYAYIVSGTDGNQVIHQVYQYDSTTNTWTRKNDFPGTARLDTCGFSIGTRGYVCLGSDNNVNLADIWEYDPQTDGWTQKTDFPGSARLLATVLVINQKAYVIGGYAAEGYKTDVWEYDPQSDTWTRKNDFPGTARSSAAGFVIGNKGYVGTGILTATGWSTTQELWEYDPQTDQWTQKTNFPGTGRGYAQGFTLGNKGYIGLGILEIGPGGNSLTLTKDLWEYDPLTNAWTQRPSITGNGRGMAVSFVIGSSGYVGLGNNENVINLSDFWKYTP